MPVLVSILFAGLVGGMLRGLVGYIKYRSSYKNVPFQAGYFSLMVGVSSVIGPLSACISQDLGIQFLGLKKITVPIAIVIGYAGGDFIENLFKILTGKTSLYQIPAIKK